MLQEYLVIRHIVGIINIQRNVTSSVKLRGVVLSLFEFGENVSLKKKVKSENHMINVQKC